MKKKILLGLVAVAIALPIGCTRHTPNPKNYPVGKDDYVWVCEYFGAIKECGYVEKKVLERELDFLRDMPRY